MRVSERTYSILIVSASDKFTDAVKALLSGSHYDPVLVARNANAARRLCAERTFDHVLINAPLPDETGTRFALDVSTNETVVLLAVPAEIHTEIFDSAAEHGVFTLSKPLSVASMRLALNWLCSARERLRLTEQKTISLEDKMNEIRLVNRAKWLLISELKMTEPDAHRYIEKQAMDRCISKGSVARDIIGTYAPK